MPCCPLKPIFRELEAGFVDYGTPSLLGFIVHWPSRGCICDEFFVKDFNCYSIIVCLHKLKIPRWTCVAAISLNSLLLTLLNNKDWVSIRSFVLLPYSVLDFPN